MKVLIVGGGGREHAIALKIKENPEVTALYAAPGNGGIAQIATCLPFKATDVDGIVRWAAENKVDFVIVAPDDPLCLGMVDALAEQGIPAFGPRKNAAIIEGSKVFSKNLMKKYGIPTAAYETFDDYDAAVKYLQTADMPIVVKADGLALGKGVLICPDRESAVEAVASMMKEAKFGASCCVVLASGGYPVSYKSGYPISGLDEAGKTATVFHAGTKLVDGQIVTAGGRVLGVTATANTLEAAIDKAYQAADKITFTDMHMRRDIGQRALASRKESHS